VIYALCFVLILIGLYGVLVRRNTVKIIVSLLVVEYGIHLFLVLQGYRPGGVPPIAEPGAKEAPWIQQSVDPLPQALVLTSIVIGLGVLALLVALSIRLYERYGTFDISKMRRLKG
jgi:multisubunit Na+/H+ antiporter MnhC subunit